MPASTFICRAIGYAGPLEHGIVGLHNNSAKPVEVRDVRVRFPAPAPAGAQINSSLYYLTGRQVLSAISALGDAGDVTFASANTANTLPAQVKLTGRASPETLTLGTTVYRSFVLCDDLIHSNGFAPQPAICSRWATRRRKGSSGKVIDQALDSSVEPITLAEGQGIACLQVAIEMPAVRRHHLTVREQASGKTYTASWNAAPASTPNNGNIWALFNGTGSGVTLEVLEYTVTDRAEGYAPSSAVVIDHPTVRLVRARGFVSKAGDSLSVGQIVSPSGATVPTGLGFFKGPFRPIIPGIESGARFDWVTTHGAVIPLDSQMLVGCFRRQAKVNQGFDTVSNLPMTVPRGWDVLFKAGDGEDGITLQPGESLAVLGGMQGILSVGCFDVYDVEMTVASPNTRAQGAQARIS